MEKKTGEGFLPRLRAMLTTQTALAALALIMIAMFHGVAHEDRFLLNLYYIGIIGTAYVLVRRRAFALTVLLIFVAFGTTLAQVYFAPKSGQTDVLLDPVIDLASLCLLLFLVWLLGMEAYRFQTEEHRMRVRREIEERAMATRAAALTSTSHEVRQPLAAIQTITEVLLDETAGPLNESQSGFVKDIHACGKHLMELVNDILDYAKAEAGMLKLAREVVALPELVHQCITMVGPKAAEEDVTVTAHVDPEVKEIVADPLRLRQILLNLLNNAVKLTESGGLAKLQVRADREEVIIAVRDTGRGITVDKMKHLFDPYYQAAHGDQGIGTGLGLSIIKHLVALHNGTISVEAASGTGSVFTVHLPRRAMPEVEAVCQEEQVLATIQDTFLTNDQDQQECAVLCES